MISPWYLIWFIIVVQMKHRCCSIHFYFLQMQIIIRFYYWFSSLLGSPYRSSQDWKLAILVKSFFKSLFKGFWFNRIENKNGFDLWKFICQIKYRRATPTFFSALKYLTTIWTGLYLGISGANATLNLIEDEDVTIVASNVTSDEEGVELFKLQFCLSNQIKLITDDFIAQIKSNNFDLIWQ